MLPSGMIAERRIIQRLLRSNAVAPGGAQPLADLRPNESTRLSRLIGDGVVDREGVPGLAGRLGYTQRHLHRMLTAELGAGPLALARAQRAQTC